MDTAESACKAGSRSPFRNAGPELRSSKWNQTGAENECAGRQSQGDDPEGRSGRPAQRGTGGKETLGRWCCQQGQSPQRPFAEMVRVGFDLASEDTHLVEDLMLAIQLSPC